MLDCDRTAGLLAASFEVLLLGQLYPIVMRKLACAHEVYSKLVTTGMINCESIDLVWCCD